MLIKFDGDDNIELSLLAALLSSGCSLLETVFGFPRLMMMEARTIWEPRTRMWTSEVTPRMTQPQPPSG